MALVDGGPQSNGQLWKSYGARSYYDPGFPGVVANKVVSTCQAKTSKDTGRDVTCIVYNTLLMTQSEAHDLPGTTATVESPDTRCHFKRKNGHVCPPDDRVEQDTLNSASHYWNLLLAATRSTGNETFEQGSVEGAESVQKSQDTRYESDFLCFAMQGTDQARNVSNSGPVQATDTFGSNHCDYEHSNVHNISLYGPSPGLEIVLIALL